MTPSQLTAAYFREPRPAGSIIPVDAACGPTIADAIEIADTAARSDIESNCERHPDRLEYDLASVDPDDGWAMIAVPQAVRYLEARGLLERDAAEPQLVRLLDEPKAGA